LGIVLEFWRWRCEKVTSCFQRQRARLNCENVSTDGKEYSLLSTIRDVSLSARPELRSFLGARFVYRLRNSSNVTSMIIFDKNWSNPPWMKRIPVDVEPCNNLGTTECLNDHLNTTTKHSNAHFRTNLPLSLTRFFAHHTHLPACPFPPLASALHLADWLKPRLLIHPSAQPTSSNSHAFGRKGTSPSDKAFSDSGEITDTML